MADSTTAAGSGTSAASEPPKAQAPTANEQAPPAPPRTAEQLRSEARKTLGVATDADSKAVDAARRQAIRAIGSPTTEMSGSQQAEVEGRLKAVNEAFDLIKNPDLAKNRERVDATRYAAWKTADDKARAQREAAAQAKRTAQQRTQTRTERPDLTDRIKPPGTGYGTPKGRQQRPRPKQAPSAGYGPFTSSGTWSTNAGARPNASHDDPEAAARNASEQERLQAALRYAEQIRLKAEAERERERAARAARAAQAAREAREAVEWKGSETDRLTDKASDTLLRKGTAPNGQRDPNNSVRRFTLAVQASDMRTVSKIVRQELAAARAPGAPPELRAIASSPNAEALMRAALMRAGEKATIANLHPRFKGYVPYPDIPRVQQGWANRELASAHRAMVKTIDLTSKGSMSIGLGRVLNVPGSKGCF